MRRLSDEGQNIVFNTADGLDKSGQYKRDTTDSVTVEEYTETYSIARAAAGGGAYNEMYQDGVYRIIRTECIPEHDAQIDIVGDSMEPTIYDGDVAFVVRDYDRLDGKIYAVNIDDTTVIKRCYFKADGLVLVSDNPEYPDRTVTADNNISVAGRVVGWATPEK
jgi:phage repressor protein C with HTH and peptisase S24 domain